VAISLPLIGHDIGVIWISSLSSFLTAPEMRHINWISPRFYPSEKISCGGHPLELKFPKFSIYFSEM